ncbi:hypothetical protein [Jejuia pallidilutea]|uniref:Pectate lyase superfamily protein domain-containing protein n=1 Tax=Jejuia pallidilutea TaxID=504487 RepID=A0A090WKP9_9FLAO|nr:hypothetical protein [Jejuia pallidilutea]GAL68017.1 hypothetical protein JCM19301_1732 [Jejuia pallidilutea]GAL71853.1 hypothetical protein JCM19302_1293 [Jejuia pallidilutea]GAL90240.1 hypothetical protein JCM19538_707 [Jejuia pallidilutea]
MKYLKPLNPFLLFLILCCCFAKGVSQEIPEILQNKTINDNNYLPDFSFAGYHNGEKVIPELVGTVVYASDYGVIANDGLDDSIALKKAIQEASKTKGTVTLQLPKGRLILSDILYLEQSNFILRGAGAGANGTEIYCPRPLMYTEDPEVLQELREYLVKFDKRQREEENNIDLPFSQYAWSGGFIWTKVPDVRVKSYLPKYENPYDVLAKVPSGKRGELNFKVSDVTKLNVGDVVELQMFNKDGENAQIIDDLYKKQDLKIGSHHWNFTDLPLVKQQVVITKISGNKVFISSPLIIDIEPSYQAQLVVWKHLEEVGIEHLSISFPKSPRIAHHVEQGYNAIYLTRVFNSWVKNVVIHNADSGVLSEEIANVTIKNITTTGENIAHYTVAMSGTYNVLGEGIKVYNKAVHPLSFNTLSTKSVYLDCEIFVEPILDQHSGANHQNLFDNIKVHLAPNADGSYPLFAGGGAGYWKPSHGAYSTFWNIQVNLLTGLELKDPVLLNGMKDGPFARVVGVNGNHKFKVEYEPMAHIECINKSLQNIPSLYMYQLRKREKNN